MIRRVALTLQRAAQCCHVAGISRSNSSLPPVPKAGSSAGDTVWEFGRQELYRDEAFQKHNPDHESSIPASFKVTFFSKIRVVARHFSALGGGAALLYTLPSESRCIEAAVLRAQHASEDWAVEERIASEWAACNVSGLSDAHRLAHRPAPVQWDWELEPAALRRRLGRWGLRSGVNPGLAWPTPSELAELKAEEAALEPQLDVSAAIQRDEVASEAALLAARTADVERKLALYPKILAEYEGRHSAAAAEAAEVESERQEKILAIQEHFGYAVEPSDPRFQQMMAQKEDDERKAERTRRKAEKDAQMIASIQQTAKEI